MIRFILSIFSIFAIVLTVFAKFEPTPCIPRLFPTGLVCVCNSTYCDFPGPIELENDDEIILMSTSENGLRFHIQREQFQISKNGKKANAQFVVKNLPRPDSFPRLTKTGIRNAVVKVERKKRYQKMIGFGAAITGTVYSILNGITEGMRELLFRTQWSEDGLGLNMMRLPIGGTDFDSHPWTYAEYPENDVTLSNFTSLNAQDMGVIKYIDQLQKLSNNYGIRFLGSAWSPPKWMKDNKIWSGQGFLLPEYYQVWADYHVRWLQLMKEQNITFWGITTGNEPTNALVAWNLIHILDLAWTAELQGIWVGMNLGPTIRKSEFKDVLIIADDDESYTMPWWMERMTITQKNALDYVDGIGFHWYLDTVVPFNKLFKNHVAYPGKIMFSSESCITGKPILGSWDRARRYMIAYYQDFDHFAQAWIHWNMVLNLEGGPTYVNHTNDAMIAVNTTSNAEFFKEPIFYLIGQWTKFIKPDSIRIHTSTKEHDVNNPIHLVRDPQFMVIAFERPDNQTTIILNNISNRTINVDINDVVKRDKGERHIKISVTIPPQSVNSLLYR